MATTKFEKPMGSEVETLKTDIATLNSKITAVDNKYSRVSYTSSDLSAIPNNSPTYVSDSYTIPSGYEVFTVENLRVQGQGSYYDWVVTTQAGFSVSGSTLNMGCRALCMGAGSSTSSKIYADIILQKI